MENNLPSTPAGVLNLLANTQTQIDVMSDGIIESVKNGEINPLDVLITIKAFEKVGERVLKEIKENYLTEAARHPEKRFEYHGNILEVGEVGTKYDYATCGDSEWERLSTDAETAKSLLSARESFLKTLKKPTEILNKITGELVYINPPLKTSQTQIKVSIK